MSHARTPLLAVAFLALVVASTAFGPARAGAALARVSVTETVNVRVAPNLSGGIVGQLVAGSTPVIRCAGSGQLIYDTPVWFYGQVGSALGFWTAYYSDAVYTTFADLEARYGIPRCDRPSTITGGSVYYQPRYSVGDPIAPYTTYTATKDHWAAGDCSAAYSAYWAPHFDGRLITRASGWSLGRLGITYLLAEYPARAERLQQLVLFDPGDLADYLSTCDQRYDQDGLMARWLSGNAQRRLLVIAGAHTRDVDHPDAQGRRHQGIQQHLFPAIRAAGQSSKVLVCNFDSMGHAEVMRRFGYLAGSGSITACPAGANWIWRP